MSTKTCSCCATGKPLEAFQIRKDSPDGRTAACRECLRLRDKARYPKEKTARLTAHRAYMATPAGAAAHKRAVQHWWAARPERRAAHVAVNNAVRDGRLLKLPCECCGDPEVEAHHPDYSRPLDVVWLCNQHHRALHEEHEIFLSTRQQFVLAST